MWPWKKTGQPKLSKARAVSLPGYYKGRHFSTYVEDAVSLKRQGKLEGAETLLLELVAATEAQDRVEGWVWLVGSTKNWRNSTGNSETPPRRLLSLSDLPPSAMLRERHHRN